MNITSLFSPLYEHHFFIFTIIRTSFLYFTPLQTQISIHHNNIYITLYLEEYISIPISFVILK
ncbi:hypothetical protein, partial [Plasmodium yoelii yoelii]